MRSPCHLILLLNLYFWSKFLLSIRLPYEVNSFNRKWQAHGGISKNTSSRPLFTIIFRPEMLKFHPYSILTGNTRVELVIYCVLRAYCPYIQCLYVRIARLLMSFSSSQWVWAQDKVEYLQNFPVPTAHNGAKNFLIKYSYFHVFNM